MMSRPRTLYEIADRVGAMLARAIAEHGHPNTFSVSELARMYGSPFDSPALFGRALLTHPVRARSALRYTASDAYLTLDYTRGGRIAIAADYP